MILIFFAHTGQIADDGDVELVEKLGITNARTLEDLCHKHIVNE